jgi:hypothetical protein
MFQAVGMCYWSLTLNIEGTMHKTFNCSTIFDSFMFQAVGMSYWSLTLNIEGTGYNTFN